MADRPATGHDAMATAPPPYRVPRDLADPLIREIGAWLDGVRPTEAREPGDPRVGPALRRLISAHGLAPALVHDPKASAVGPTLPEDLRAWLADQDVRNRRRIGRLLEELGAALRAFGAAGVPVMPLKGAILATRPNRDPFRRPMADLDLLVRPGDLEAARATLTALGYRRRLDRTRRPTHDTFELSGNTAVVAADGEHPDNPRRIELHTEVRRHLWGWVDDDELTAFLWAGAIEATVLREPAMLPAPRAFAAHLAIHATSDLLLGRGRLLQWLDLAEVLGDGGMASADLGHAPHSRLVYPAVRLAMRRLRGRFDPLAASSSGGQAEPGSPGEPSGLEALEALVPERLARWAATVPLDTRAGLGAGRSTPADASTISERWLRWAPYRWRLAVAHGGAPLPVAAVRHAARLTAMARRRPS